MSNKVIEILLVSDSKLLINGLRKIFESEVCIRVIAELSDIKEVQDFMNENEPDYIFLDKRVKDSGIEKLLLSKKIKSKGTVIILLSDEDENGDSPASFITVNQSTSAVELVDIIQNRRELQKDSIIKNAIIKETEINVTKTESKIISLITSGRTNKEIAEKLKVSEKTIKAHITSIFTKLNIQNRYQLMIYGRRNMKRI
jgi:DNA-binding NarL/FixJ family response regulator